MKDEEKFEQEQIEALFRHRKDTSEFLDGGSKELLDKAIESFRKRKDKLKEFKL